MRTLQPSTDDDDAGSGVSRRAMLRGAAAAGLASGLVGKPVKVLARSVGGSHEWAEFGAAVTLYVPAAAHGGCCCGGHQR